MGKLFLSIPTIVAGAISAQNASWMIQSGKHQAMRIWPQRKWILGTAFSALVVATLSFAWVSRQASTNVTPPQGARASIDQSILRLSGSKMIGSTLAPELVKAWLVSIKASDVEEADRFEPGTNQVVGSVISAKLNGTPVVVEVTAHGSANAFNDMATGDADIAITSREINSSESTRLLPLGDMRSQASEHVLGLETIAVIVPRSNPISSLSQSALKKIFTGQITNWSAVGMKRLPIHLYARNTNSRTNDKFASLVLGNDPMADAKLYDDSAKLESDVASDPGGIGFVTVPYVKDTRSVSISDQTAAPLGRQLYLYTASAPRNPTVTDFLRFAASPEGQNIVSQVRFVPPSREVSVSSNNAAAIATAGENLKISISVSDDRAKQNLPAPPAPSRPTPPSVTAVVPDVAIDRARATSGPSTVTASLQPPPPPPAVTASLQPPAPSTRQASPPVVRAVPPPPAPDRLALPPLVNLQPPPVSPAQTAQTPPVPINSHAVLASDYPLNSIRMEEQGTVRVRYQVREDGSVGDCTVTKSSDKPALDDAACAMVTGRWKFKPATKDGKPVAEFLTAEVAFKLTEVPNGPAPTSTALLSRPPTPPAPPPAVKVPRDPRLPTPPEPITSHVVTVDDYPVASRGLQEQGTVEVKYLVGEDGVVSDCSVTASSGKRLLDIAACTIVKRRWKFKPAMKDGKPFADTVTAGVIFRLK